MCVNYRSRYKLDQRDRKLPYSETNDSYSKFVYSLQLVAGKSRPLLRERRANQSQQSLARQRGLGRLTRLRKQKRMQTMAKNSMPLGE